jgi:4-hydroxyphenylpyruvate dioxygenase-like putative hemolysin
MSLSGPLANHYLGIDHIAIAVSSLEDALSWYRDVLGFEALERRATEGQKTSMLSAVLRGGDSIFVLVQGTSPESQVSRFVARYGCGVQHVAIGVRDLQGAVAKLEAAGLAFNTSIIRGTGICQAFTERHESSGMMIELIERLSPDGHFTDESVAELFRQLEVRGAY